MMTYAIHNVMVITTRRDADCVDRKELLWFP